MYDTPTGYNYKENYAFTYATTLRWLESKIMGKNVADFFHINDFKTIAICTRGQLNNLGKLLYKDIINSKVEVRFFYDHIYSARYPNGILGKPVIDSNNLLNQDVDIFVVAPVFHFNEIVKDLQKAGVPIEKIVSLTEIIYSL